MLSLIFFAALLIGILIASFYLLIPLIQLINANLFNAGLNALHVLNDTLGQIQNENIRNTLSTGVNNTIGTFTLQFNMMNLLIQNAWILILITFVITLFIIARQISEMQRGLIR